MSSVTWCGSQGCPVQGQEVDFADPRETLPS